MRPDPQYGVQLSVADIPLELPISPIYGVTSSNRYIPVQVDNDGKLSVGNVTITGPVTINDVVIKGVDPDNGNTSEDFGVYNLGLGNGYAMRSTLFDGGNHLKIETDGSADVYITGTGIAIPVTIDHSLDSVAIYGTDGSTDRFIKTDSSGNLQVGIVGGSISVTQGTSPWVVSGSTGRTWTLSSGTDSINAVQSTSPWVVSGTAAVTGTVTVTQSTGTNLHTVVDSGSVNAAVTGTITANQGSANVTPWNENLVQIAGSTIATAATGIAKVGLTDGSGNAITSTSSALDINIKSTTNGAPSSSVTSVARSNVVQTFLASNISRKGATIYNDSGALVYVKFGLTASTTDFTVRMASQSYYEVPFNYTGIITGIWAANGAGDARMTELT